MSRIDELLKEDSKVSSMRYALLWVVWMSLVLVLSASFHIVYNTVSDRDISWNGIAILLGALTLFLGAAATGKWLQKKQEVDHENH